MVSFTDRAKEMVLAFMGQGDGALEALRISMEGSPLAPRFELTLVGREERRPDEDEVDAGGFTVLLAGSDAPVLEDAVVDFVERVNESGFEVRTKSSAGGATTEGGRSAGAPGPEGELADRVRDLLDGQVNPGIAAHGGVITLVDVKGTEIFLEMSGGCQGCAMSRLTLRQGVERMLRQAIPEITEVHDVTDHSSGANPYF
jgi:Fe/S biogenesis protein NfuA